jgi:cell division protein FtsN
LAQDDYYYEIQLTNKQLVFYFMAGAAGLILSFLAGVMVGRGVDAGASAAETTRHIGEPRVVSEASPSPAPAPTELNYAKELEAEHPVDKLQGTGTPRPLAATAAPAPAPTPRPTSTPAAKATPTPAPPAPKTSSTPARGSTGLPKSLPSSSPGFYVQVGAFKDRASAESVVRSLKGKAMPAYVETPAGSGTGLFTVRVGVYGERADAEVLADRLKEDKFKPYIQKQ